MRKLISKVIILLLFMLVLFFTTSIAFSSFDDLNQTKSQSLQLGEWWSPISTPQEFYNMVTTCNCELSYDRYYLTQDLDFSEFDWTIDSSNANTIFCGYFDGNNHKISNLTVYTELTTDTYLGIFSIIQNATIKNITFENVHINFFKYALYFSNYRSGLLAGQATGTNTIDNVSIINSSVKGTKYSGVGGLIGRVSELETSLTINRIKATNLKIFSKNFYVGGLIGYIEDKVNSISISNIDFEGEIFSSNKYSFVGGLIGKVNNGPIISINQVILEFKSINTIETSCCFFNDYSKKYIGGLIAYNQSVDKLSINNTFLTGELITQCSYSSIYVGTLLAKNTGDYIGSNNFYAAVLFRQADGSINFDPNPDAVGVFSNEINDGALPTLAQWNIMSTYFDMTIWSQADTGRLFLNLIT